MEYMGRFYKKAGFARYASPDAPLFNLDQLLY